MRKRTPGTTWRMALLVSAGLGLNVSVFAQPAAPDPFAPDTLAPYEPGALPNAPAPVAPQLPPAPEPAPSAQAMPAAQPAPLPEPALAQPNLPAPEKVVTAPQPSSDVAPSFWDNLTNLFETDDEAETAGKEEAEQQAEKPKSIASPAPKPVEPAQAAPAEETPNFFDQIGKLFKPEENNTPAESTKAVEVKAPQPAALVTAPKLTVTLPQTPVVDPQPYAVQADPASTDPFATQTQAPTTPLSTPQASQVVAPQPPAPLKVVSTPPAQIEATPKAAVESAPAQISEPKVRPPVPSADEDGPGFFDRIANLFGGEEQEVAPEVKATEKETLAATQEAQPIAEVKEEITTGKAAPQTPEREEGLFDRLSNLFGSDEEDTRHIEVESTPKAPTKTEDVAALTSEDESFFDRVGSFFDETFYEEKAPAKSSAPTSPMKTRPKVSAPIPKLPEPQPTTKPIDPRLINARLGLGDAIYLGQHANALSPAAKCFTKNRGTIAFCLTPTSWPDKVGIHFEVSSHLYKGTQGIIQFDGDTATRVLSLFNRDGIKDVVHHFSTLLGEPTHIFNRTTRTLKMGVIDNPTYVWEKENPTTGINEILEIRSIADIRGSIPDLQRGVVRSYYGGSREIFSLTSDLDFMNLR